LRSVAKKDVAGEGVEISSTEAYHVARRERGKPALAGPVKVVVGRSARTAACARRKSAFYKDRATMALYGDMVISTVCIQAMPEISQSFNFAR